MRGLLLVVLVVAGCATDEGTEPGSVGICGVCTSDVDCVEGASCDRRSCVAGTSCESPWLCKRPWQYQEHYACDAECSIPEVPLYGGMLSMCAYEGACVAEGGECVAASEDDCLDSWVCALYGRCFLVNGQCAK
jgi:hypothetical protein